MDEVTFWQLAFISLVSIKEHPRNEDGADLNVCATLADQMVQEFKSRYEELN